MTLTRGVEQSPKTRVTACFGRQYLLFEEMNQELEVLQGELRRIQNNVNGGCGKNSGIYLTHSEVISFARAFIYAVNNSMIHPFPYRWQMS